MWRIIITSLLYVIMVESRPMDSLEGPLWLQDLSIPAQELFARRNPDVHSQRNFNQNRYNPDADDYDLVIPQLSQKRALTMFSRWSPISNIGKQRTPIRSNPNTLPFSQIRDRQHGQPLRWG